MRVRKIPAVALVALAAGLSLTACGNDGATGASADATPSATTAAAQGGSGSTGSSGSSDSSGGSGSTAAPQATTGGNGSTAAPADDSHATGGSACRTAHLSFTTSYGMGEGELLVNLENTGAGACTLHGFPGVDLQGRDGTISAARSKAAAPDVTLPAGQETRFTLHFPPNNTGGSGVTFTGLIVTPPNETHSHTIALTLNLPAGDSSTPGVVVDPVGAGK
jgi:hypothetical protein